MHGPNSQSTLYVIVPQGTEDIKCIVQVRANIAASFQAVAVKHLEHRCRRGISWALETSPDIKCAVLMTAYNVADQLDL